MRTLIILLCGLLCATSLFPQQGNGFINQLPDYPNISSPMAKSFQKYIDHPVNLYNGTPDITIPLLELKDGDISLPLALRYNSSGIRADEEASWVGLGWNLNAGGIITQSIVGECDYNDTEYATLVNYLGLSDKKIYNDYDAVGYTEALQNKLRSYFNSPGQLYHSGKMNPDVFYFSYPGGSGKFIIDYRDNSIHQLNRDEDIKIRISKTDNAFAIKNREFQIITTEGIVHTFTYMASTYPNQSTGRPLSISYALTSSFYPNGQYVRYTYVTNAIKLMRKSYFFQAPYASTGQSKYLGDRYNGESETEINGSEFYLNKITTPHYEVSFALADRDDVWGGRQLTSIKVNPSGNASNVLKDIRFEYSYFEATGTTGLWTPLISGWKSGYSKKRLKLTSVFHQKGTLKNDCHTFFYNDVVPDKYTYNIDYWGYYNGTSGNRRNTYLPELSGMKWGRYLQMGLQTSIGDIFSKYSYTNYSNRSYSFTDCQAGILKGIQYPTGGYVEYTYEPNSFIDKKLPDKTSETLVREDWNRPSDAGAGSSFTLPGDCEVEIEGRIGRGLNTWQEIWEVQESASVTLLRATGKGVPSTVCFTHSFKDECLYQANHAPASTEIVVKTKLRLEAKAPSGESYTYYLYAGFPDALGLQYGASTKHGSTRLQVSYKLNSALVDSEIQGCGVRVKSIKTYEQKGNTTPVMSTDYEYKDPVSNVCSGVLHDQVLFVKPYQGVYNYLADHSLSGVEKVLVQQNVAEISSENAISNPYASIGGVGYSYVKEIRDGATNSAGYTVYQYKNEVPNFTSGSVRTDHPQNGKLLSMKSYTSGQQLLKSELYTYLTNTAHYYWGVTMLDYMNMFTGIYASNSQVSVLPYDENYGYYNGRLRTVLHRLNACSVSLTRKETIQDGVSTVEEYGYDTSTLQLLRRSIKTSGTDSLTYTYAYPNHFKFAPYSDMTLKNMIKPVVESRMLKNGNIKRGLLTQYSLWPGLNKIFPSSRSESQIAGNIGNPSALSSSGASIYIYPYVSTSWDKYDSQGNCLAATVRNVKTVFLWAYNSLYPVAKIEGATYAEVEGWLTAATISSLATNTTTVSTALDGIRDKLSGKGVLVTTYTYQPLVGMTSMTAPNGEKTSYVYDSFDRLYQVKDHNGKVVEQYDYHYKN
ncbi:hypothetical protein [Bacteroides sp.]|uniref:hypothetical protein n=1 Tax=Bacteroides sp. TaxID=29523 RepID=UPI003AB5BFE5